MQHVSTLLSYHQAFWRTDTILMFVYSCNIVKFIKKIQQDAKMYPNFIIPYLYKAQHFSGDTPPIIRSIKLHWQPLVLYTWKVVGRVDGGLCQAQYCA
jgi:hypothetical protein